MQLQIGRTSPALLAFFIAGFLQLLVKVTSQSDPPKTGSSTQPSSTACSSNNPCDDHDKIDKDYIIYGAVVSGIVHLISLIIILCLVVYRRRGLQTQPSESQTFVKESTSGKRDQDRFQSLKLHGDTVTSLAVSEASIEDNIEHKSIRSKGLSNQEGSHDRSGSFSFFGRKRSSTFREVQSPRASTMYSSDTARTSIKTSTGHFGLTDDQLVETYPDATASPQTSPGYNSKTDQYTNGRERTDTFD